MPSIKSENYIQKILGPKFRKKMAKFNGMSIQTSISGTGPVICVYATADDT